MLAATVDAQQERLCREAVETDRCLICLERLRAQPVVLRLDGGGEDQGLAGRLVVAPVRLRGWGEGEVSERRLCESV